MQLHLCIAEALGFNLGTQRGLSAATCLGQVGAYVCRWEWVPRPMSILHMMTIHLLTTVRVCLCLWQVKRMSLSIERALQQDARSVHVYAMHVRVLM